MNLSEGEEWGWGLGESVVREDFENNRFGYIYIGHGGHSIA